MPPPQQSGSQNQSLLELIFAMKSLAQQVEFYHQDLTRRLDEDVRIRQRDLARLADLTGKNSQSLTTLPVAIADRVEKLLSRIEQDMKQQFDTTSQALGEVSRTLEIYARTTERAISQSEMTAAFEEVVKEERRDGQLEKQQEISRIEVSEKGVKLFLQQKVIKKLLYGIVAVAASGGAYSFVKLVKDLLGP